MALVRWFACAVVCLPLFAAALAAQQVPTADEMAFIYELNRARNNPQRYDTENLTTYKGGMYSGILNSVAAQPPLALNDNLVQSARFHSNEMATYGYFAHKSAVTGDYANDMARDAGYPLDSALPAGTNNIESIAVIGTSGSSISYPPNDALRNLLIDKNTNPPGHRIHLLAMDSFNQTFREVGTGYAEGNGWMTGVNAAAYWSIHTGRRGSDPVRVFGVVYDDANGNGRYDSGEGLSGVTVTATGSSTMQVTSNARGAYVFDVTSGSWTIGASGSPFSGSASATVSVGSDNMEVDFVSGRSSGERDFEFQSVGGGPVLTATPGSLAFNAPTPGPGNPSAEDSFTISGVRLVGNVTVTAPSEFQVSTTSGSGFGSSVTLTPSGGTLVSTTVYVRFNPSGSSGASGAVTCTADGAVDALVSVTGTVSTNPALFVSPTSLNLVADRLGAASPEMSYTVSGYNLSTDIVIAAPSDFEVSLTSGSGFSSGFSIAPTTGTVSPTTIFVRYTPTTLGGSGTITNTSTALSADVTVNGSVTNSPQISVNPTSLTLVAPVLSTPSGEQTFTISGQYLGGDINLAAPSGFDFTLTSGSGYTTSLALTPTAGVVGSTTVYVRFLGGTSTASGNIDCTSTLAATKQVALNGSIAPPPNITLSTSSLALDSTGVGVASAVKQYSVTGTNLVGDVMLSTSSGFQVSQSATTGFSTTLTLTQSGGNVSATVYVRYTPISAGLVSDSIAHTSAGATDRYLSLTGTVTAPGTTNSSGNNSGGGGCTGSGTGGLPLVVLLALVGVALSLRRKRERQS